MSPPAESDDPEGSINYINYSDIQAETDVTSSKPEPQSQSEDAELGNYQLLNKSTMDYLSVYAHLDRHARIEEGDSLPRTITNSLQRRARCFLGRKPKKQVTEPHAPRAAVPSPSGQRIRHSAPTNAM